MLLMLIPPLFLLRTIVAAPLAALDVAVVATNVVAPRRLHV